MREIRNYLRKYQDILVPLVLLLVAVAGIFLGIIPASRRTWALFGDVQSTTSKVVSLRQKATVLASLNEDDLRQELVSVISAVPPDKSLPSIFQTIDQVSAQSGVSLQDMALGNPGSLATEAAKKQTTEEKALGSSLIPFSVNVSGSLDSIGSFLTRVTAVRRLVRLRNLDVSFMGANVTLRASLDAFYAPLPQISAQTEQPLPTLTSDENMLLSKLSAYPWLSQSLTSAYVSTGAGKINPFAP